jgi:hypothetical protein
VRNTALKGKQGESWPADGFSTRCTFGGTNDVLVVLCRIDFKQFIEIKYLIKRQNCF